MKFTNKMTALMAAFLDLQKEMTETLAQQPKCEKEAKGIVLAASALMGKTVNQVKDIIDLSESMTDKEFKDLYRRGLPIKSRKDFISKAKQYVEELSKELALVKRKIEEIKEAEA